MNENINLCEILRDCPKGTKFYSYIFGDETYFQGFSLCEGKPILIIIYGKKGEWQNFYLSRKGHPYADNYGECCIFPSKEMRDWSKFTAPWLKKERFDPKTLKPFDKILVRDSRIENWYAAQFSHIAFDFSEYDLDDCGEKVDFIICTTGSAVFSYCIPFNDDTKSLIGTTEDAPEIYKYWED